MNLNFLRKATQKTGIYYHLANFYVNNFVKPKYKRLEKLNRLKFEDLKANTKNVLVSKTAMQITNLLPNSGGIPIEVDSIEISNLKSEIIKKESRKIDIENFEGMALDDAVALDSWKHFSFLKLAQTISEIAKNNSSKETFTVLELGCGAGSMFEYFQIMGASLYIGLDGNPLGFKYSPIISKNMEFFRLVNLQEEINFNKPFDLVYTSEVLEHIRKDKTDVFIKTISNHMDKNSIFLGTIAFTKMDVHINTHNRKWWVEKFSKQNLFSFKDSVLIEKKLAINHPYNWNKNTSHIFALKKI